MSYAYLFDTQRNRHLDICFTRFHKSSNLPSLCFRFLTL
jgi:hypothetical protein